jgi:sirohydrochlorin cobaltochelatase
VILLAHGGRSARWRRPFEALREQVSDALAPAEVTLAYLQLCRPTLEEALRGCGARGAVEVLVIPVFLSGGGHLLRDLPRAVAAAAAGQPDLRVEISGALGEEREALDGMVRACLRLATAGRGGGQSSP